MLGSWDERQVTGEKPPRLIPPKPTKAPLRRITNYNTAILTRQYGFGFMLALECGHYVHHPRLPKGTIDSWRRVRCKECVK